MTRWIMHWFESLERSRTAPTDGRKPTENADAERRIRRIVSIAVLGLAAIPCLHQLAVRSSVAHAQARPIYSGPAPSQQALHGWPAYARAMAYAPAQRPRAAYTAPVSYRPTGPAWLAHAPGWGYAPLSPQPSHYPIAVAPVWPSHGAVAGQYPPIGYPGWTYYHPAPYQPWYPSGYGYAPPEGYGQAPTPYQPRRPTPERVYYLTAEDQRVVDELDRRLSRVKGILSESREFDTQAATILFLHEVAEALEYMPQIHAEMRAMNNEIRRTNYMLTALPVLAWDLHQVNQKIGLMAWDINRTMGRMGGMMSLMPFF